MFRFDESDPELLVVYTGSAHAELSDYQQLVERVLARRDSGPRFGLLLVYEPHEHDEAEHDHSPEEEAAYTRLLNDLRRNHRAWLNQRCLGYASILPPAYQPPADAEAAWAQMRAETDRFARYTLGVPGNTFAGEDEARRWLREQVGRRPIELDGPDEPEPEAAQRVGLFYGSTTGVTEYVAEAIAEAWQAAGLPPLAMVNIADLSTADALLAYDHLIFGISTWNIGQLQDDWEMLLPQIATLDLSGMPVALFGVGDQVAYDENFLDAVGTVAATLRERGAVLAGRWPADGYQFTASLALDGDELLGLGIDEINQHEQTAERVAAWVAQLSTEWKLQPSPAVAGA